MRSSDKSSCVSNSPPVALPQEGTGDGQAEPRGVGTSTDTSTTLPDCIIITVLLFSADCRLWCLFFTFCCEIPKSFFCDCDKIIKIVVILTNYKGNLKFGVRINYPNPIDLYILGIGGVCSVRKMNLDGS